MSVRACSCTTKFALQIVNRSSRSFLCESMRVQFSIHTLIIWRARKSRNGVLSSSKNWQSFVYFTRCFVVIAMLIIASVQRRRELSYLLLNKFCNNSISIWLLYFCLHDLASFGTLCLFMSIYFLAIFETCSNRIISTGNLVKSNCLEPTSNPTT